MHWQAVYKWKLPHTQKNNNNKNRKNNLNLSLLTSYFRTDRSLPYILLPVAMVFLSTNQKIWIDPFSQSYNSATIFFCYELSKDNSRLLNWIINNTFLSFWNLEMRLHVTTSWDKRKLSFYCLRINFKLGWYWTFTRFFADVAIL